MPKVVFQVENASEVIAECNVGENLLALARRSNVAIDAPCSGNGSCGKCRIKLLSGDLQTVKSRHLSQEEFADGWRLSCHCAVLSDCIIFVPDIASAYRARMKVADLSSPEELAIFEETKKNLPANDIPFANRFLALDISIDAPTANDATPDSQRLSQAIQTKTQANAVELPIFVTQKLTPTLRAHSFHVCVKGELVNNIFRCMDVCAPADTALVGCAIDIGTTTVSAVLTDLRSGKLLAKGASGNGQIRYGADVIHRIIEQSKPDGRQKLQDAIIKETLIPLLTDLCHDAQLNPHSILRLSVSANTTMNHLLLGVDATPIRVEPYTPVFFHREGLLAKELSLPANPLAPVLIAPNVGSYVGGDITAGTLASGIWNKDEMRLFIDLGTNGELVFGNREFLMCCACSAGPAFEGGDISYGMRATDGAIEACAIDPATMEPTLRVIGKAGQRAVGICGSGIIDIVSELFRCGILNAKGLFVRESARILQDTHGMKRYILASAEESETGREISISEVDIDNFIRAKGAIYSAVDTLLQSVDMTADQISEVYIAGGIGSGINVKNAIRIGMLPDLAVEKFQYMGNTSLTGAYAMVLSDAACTKIHEVSANMTYLELSTFPGYMDAFVAACFLPHTDARRFPHGTQID